MKRLLGFILLASAMPALFSCTKENDLSPEPEMREMVITATREDAEPGTKTEIVDDKTYWSVGDKISVFFGSGTNGGAEFTSTNTEAAASADFTGILNAVTGSEEGSSSQKYFWGVYPYSEENSLVLSGSSNILTTVVSDFQYGAPDSFSAGQNIWIGRSPGLELSFKSLLSGIKLSFSRSDITRVTIQGNNGENLAGKVNVTMDSGDPIVSSVVEGKTVLTLVPENGDTFVSGPYYRALFLPTAFTKGLTITFYTSDGSIGKRKYSKLTFERNKPKSATEAEKNVSFVSPSYVDMGNGLLMATFNVGATSPEESGDYFAWGETIPKGNYSYDTYMWGSSSSDLTKYVIDSYSGTLDYHGILMAEDDAATKNWGTAWRTPNFDEWETLEKPALYTWSWNDDYNGTGVAGYTVTSVENGNSIFLPAAGFMQGETLSNNGPSGNYMSADIVGGQTYLSMKFSFSNGVQQLATENRKNGLSVRPIYAPRKAVTGVSFDKTTFTVPDGDFIKIQSYINITPSDAFDTGYHIYITDTNIAYTTPSTGYNSGDGTMMVWGKNPGTTRIFVQTSDGSFIASANLQVTSPATGISLDQTSYTFGGNYLDGLTPLQLKATVTPSSASQTCIWSSSDESVATVSQSGVVTPVGNGTATITASKGSLSATCSVTVDAWIRVTGITLNKNTLTVTANSTFQLKATLTPSNATNKSLTWSTSDNNVAALDNTGKLTLKKPGIAQIQVVSPDYVIANCIVTVVSVVQNNPSYPDSDYTGFVDMGNGYYIAATNVGAEHAWDYGSAFAWGDSKAKEVAPTWAGYKYFAGGWVNKADYPNTPSMWLPILNKYVVSPDDVYNYPSSLIDGKVTLEASDDPATAVWGSYWNSGTSASWKALFNNCNIEEETVNGVLGAMLESKTNGAKVFIPYGGFYKDNMYGLTWNDRGEAAYLWTNNPNTVNPHNARSFKIDSSGATLKQTVRRIIMNVRPMHKD
ncbi:MAG: Ig-like domain-containing protein [Bacteroidales bacterium]|nr:Ig-like domain-containing protein [Bacteroidales bacterium]